MNTYATGRSASFGVLALACLVALYLGVLTMLSGWTYTAGQFSDFWYYVLPLAAGFGLQVALYTRLREVLRESRAAGTAVAVSGTTSATAMMSCCAHYLANVAPVLGATGIVALAAQYQVEFFWLGIAFNAAGIVYIGNKLRKALKEHELCLHA